MTTPTPIRYVVIEGTVCDVNATGFDDSVVPLYVSAKHYDALKSDLAAAQEARQRAEALAEKINQILLPDPHDEREVSAEWQVKAIRAAIDAAREGK